MKKYNFSKENAALENFLTKIYVIVINSKYLHDGKYFGYFCRYVRISFNSPQGCRGKWLKTATTTKFILNKNNTSEVQITILTWYREIQDICNPYTTLKCHNRKFYSLIYDDIQKFSRELNSSFVHSLSATNKIDIMLWGLTEICEDSLNVQSFDSPQEFH